MKFTIFFAGLLGVLLAPALAEYNVNSGDSNNSGGSGQLSVSVNNAQNVANVDNNDGLDSWNLLLDYNTGFAAVRVFRKKACIVHRMNKGVMPSLQALDAMVKEKKFQGEGPGGPPPKGLTYSVNPDKVDNLDKFGKPIVGMCKGVPTYMAEEIQGASLAFALSVCFSTIIPPFSALSFCGTLTGK
ncbi:gastrokine-1-like [Myotis daubentonii]|uniref:gastrokine-1-like n=1 Tax=Myotis daubentonii TaxID=98922 RepID=UPI0028733F0D|nr:gastrokine-1-like [Myotis daubentonii]